MSAAMELRAIVRAAHTLIYKWLGADELDQAFLVLVTSLLANGTV